MVGKENFKLDLILIGNDITYIGRKRKFSRLDLIAMSLVLRNTV